MMFVQDLSNRFDLMKSMATLCGYDLSESIARGHRNAHDVRGGAFRCTGCGYRPACETLLATTPGLRSAPDYCRNTSLFDRVSRSAG